MRSTAEFECECKVKTQFDYVIPTFGTPSFQDVSCRGCRAVWTMRFRMDLQGRVKFTFKLTTPSVALGEYLKKKKADELRNAPQKKSPIFVVPGFGKP